MSKDIKNSLSFLPKRAQSKELYPKLTELIDFLTNEYGKELDDVRFKHRAPEKISPQAVKEVLIEQGYDYIADLLDYIDGIDVQNVVAFVGYISLYKGSRFGYETILRLLKFDYEMVEWWEENGTKEPNTFSLDLKLNSSDVASPYETFQKVKRFTAEYVFPIISPLGYTFVIEFKGPSIACHGASVQTLNSLMSDTTVLPETMFGPSNWVVKDESGQNWIIRVNNLGQLKAFKTNREPQVFVTLLSDTQSPFNAFVSTEGEVSFDDTVTAGLSRQYVVLMDNQKKNWFIYITGDGELVVANTFVTFDSLLTEGFLVLLQENGRIIGI